MPVSIQSANYVPGLSGMRLDLATGDFELNSASIAVGSLPTEPQPITITVGEWPDSELPSNAIERYRFVGDQVMSIPDEYRDSAEFSTEDFSFDRDGSDYRTTLTYVRQETSGEAKARVEKEKVAGTRVSRAGGVVTFVHDGVVRCKFGNLAKVEVEQPFMVQGAQVFITQAVVDGAAISNAFGSQLLVSADAFAIKERSAYEVLDKISTVIGELSLAAALESPVPGIVRDTIRAELRPGGLLHRSR